MNRQAARLETFWAGEFGDAYTDRNLPDKRRTRFWNRILAKTAPERVLEIGCNRGGNLTWIAKRVPPRCVFGVDVNDYALRILKKSLPAVNAVWAQAKELPFADRYFDLVFTAGVLIHQPETSLRQVMCEAVRCSRRFIICLEYYSGETEEVLYRGHRGALFKRDYGRLYLKLFPSLRLVDTGFLGRHEGWDNVTFWLFEKKKKISGR